MARHHGQVGLPQVVADPCLLHHGQVGIPQVVTDYCLLHHYEYDTLLALWQADSDGGKKIRCTWYRDDRTLFKNLGVKVAKGPAHQYVIRRIGRKWWVLVDGQPLFTAADAKRLPAHGFGLMTWGKNPGFDRVVLTRLKPPASRGR